MKTSGGWTPGPMQLATARPCNFRDEYTCADTETWMAVGPKSVNIVSVIPEPRLQ